MSTVVNALNSLKSIEADLAQRGEVISCKLELGSGNWGGKQLLVSVSAAAAVLVARQLLQLVERDLDGAHFDIDRASIAPDAVDQLCFSLKTSTEVSHA